MCERDLKQVEYTGFAGVGKRFYDVVVEAATTVNVLLTVEHSFHVKLV